MDKGYYKFYIDELSDHWAIDLMQDDKSKPILKLFINIRREYKISCSHTVSPLLEYGITAMWNSRSIQAETVSIKTPGKFRISGEPVRVCHVNKAQSFRCIWGICPPETFVSPEVRQSGIDTHSRTSRDRKSFSIGNNLSSFFDQFRTHE